MAALSLARDPTITLGRDAGCRHPTGSARQGVTASGPSEATTVPRPRPRGAGDERRVMGPRLMGRAHHH